VLPCLDRGDYLSVSLFVKLLYCHGSMLDFLLYLLIIASFVANNVIFDHLSTLTLDDTTNFVDQIFNTSDVLPDDPHQG
jgi:hypothetical protein